MKKAEIILFEKGDHISYANCGLPCYIGDVIKDQNALFVQTAVGFKNRFAIDVRTKTEITAIDSKHKTVTAVHRTSGEIYNESYDKLVLSPGAEPIRPPLPGIDAEGIFTLRNVADTDNIKSFVPAVTVYGNQAPVSWQKYWNTKRVWRYKCLVS